MFLDFQDLSGYLNFQIALCYLLKKWREYGKLVFYFHCWIIWFFSPLSWWKLFGGFLLSSHHLEDSPPISFLFLLSFERSLTSLSIKRCVPQRRKSCFFTVIRPSFKKLSRNAIGEISWNSLLFCGRKLLSLRHFIFCLFFQLFEISWSELPQLVI